MTRLSQSIAQASELLASADLAGDEPVAELLSITYERRRLDLSDLSPLEQAGLIAQRTEQLQPSAEALAAAGVYRGSAWGGRSWPSSASTPPARR